MSINVTKTPGLIALSKNVAVFQVSSPEERDIDGFLEVEAIHGSDIYEPVVSLRSKPFNKVCTFYIHDLLEEDVLQYAVPKALAEFNDDTVCRMIRMRFIEFKERILLLQFFAAGGLSGMPILTNGQQYWIIMDKSTDSNITLSDGVNNKSITLSPYFKNSEETWYALTADSPYQGYIGPAQATIRFYEGLPPGIATTDKIPAIIAGRSFENIRI